MGCARGAKKCTIVCREVSSVISGGWKQTHRKTPIAMFKAKIWLTGTTSENTLHTFALYPWIIAGPVEVLLKGSTKFEVYTTIWWTTKKFHMLKLDQMKLTSLCMSGTLTWNDTITAPTVQECGPWGLSPFLFICHKFSPNFASNMRQIC